MKRIAFTLLVVLGTLPLQAQAVRTWVSTGGVDTNPCSRTEPCRNFNAAILAVAPRGEVVALDSGGYGPVLVQKSVSLVAPFGIHAAIAPTSGAAITIDAAETDAVDLRGLYLNGLGAERGILVQQVARYHMERISVNGFSDGIYGGSGLGNLTDSVIRNNGQGVVVSLSSMTINRVRLSGNSVVGVLASDADVNIRDTVAVAGYIEGEIAAAGFAARAVGIGGTNLVLENCLASAPAAALYVNSQGGLMSVTATRSTFVNATYGVQAQNDGVIRLSECTIVHNSVGVGNSSSTVIETRGNNTIRGNGVDVSGTAPTLIPGT